MFIKWFQLQHDTKKKFMLNSKVKVWTIPHAFTKDNIIREITKTDTFLPVPKSGHGIAAVHFSALTHESTQEELARL